MKFFADTAEIADIKELAATGLLDGVTTNPSIVKAEGRIDFYPHLRQIREIPQLRALAATVAVDSITGRKGASAADCGFAPPSAQANRSR